MEVYMLVYVNEKGFFKISFQTKKGYHFTFRKDDTLYRILINTPYFYKEYKIKK